MLTNSSRRVSEHIQTVDCNIYWTVKISTIGCGSKFRPERESPATSRLVGLKNNKSISNDFSYVLFKIKAIFFNLLQFYLVEEINTQAIFLAPKMIIVVLK